jgi:NAD(P)-dependent dehydrogenase (short-subunit alcohol dehydrogenase family)
MTVAIDLRDRVALVTGGGYGMGRASAQRFATAGARVVLCDIDRDRGEQTVTLIAEQGGTATFVHADVSEHTDVQRLIAHIRGTHGRLDFAHNNAGLIEQQLDITELPLEQWHRTLATNLTGVFLCLKHELPLILESGGGAIVNVASEAAFKGTVADAAYTATKHGVVGLTKVVAAAYAARNIRVNAIAPGNVLTGITEKARAEMSDQQWEALANAQPIGRLSQPDEIAELVVWLCSDAARLVNGVLMPIDAGWHVT